MKIFNVQLKSNKTLECRKLHTEKEVQLVLLCCPFFSVLQRNNSLAEFDHLKEPLNGFLAVEKSS